MEKCLVCGHKWEKIKELPISCPKCRSRLWMIGYNIHCSICNRLSFIPVIHHIDGNHNNHIQKNLIILCQDCHTAIHHGISNKRKIRGKTGKNRDYKRIKNNSLQEEDFLVVRKIKIYQRKIQSWKTQK